MFNNLNINGINEIESEGDSDLFKQLLKERLCKRADNTDIMKNKNLNKNNKKVKKRKGIYPKENSCDEQSYKKI